MREFHNPIFIVCAPRSGSTLLRLILDAHPNIAIPPPAWLYELIRPYLYSYGDCNDTANFLELCEDMLETPTIKRWNLNIDASDLAKKSKQQNFAAVYEALHIIYAEATGKQRWGEKTPRNSFWIDEIKMDFPDAKIVHILRDGRDMAIDIADTPEMRPFTLYSGAHVWKRFVKSIRDSINRIPSDDYCEIKYEDLCADPEAELKKLCRFLREDFDPAMLDHHKTESAKDWSSDSQHAKTARPITTDYCEMYKTRLPKGDLAFLDYVIGDLLEECGYPVNGRTEIPERLTNQLIQSDIVTSPDNYEHKAWLVQRRRKRLDRGVYSIQDQETLLWGMQ